MKYILVFILILSGISLEAQQNRFVFFQAQSGKPFYVRLGADNYSSSSFGHLVIPRLKDSTYHFFVGFPKNEFPEREFVVDLQGKDRGYDIRMENQADVILFEWQSGSMIRHSGKEDPSMLAMRGTKRSDPYAMLMAGVVNDPLVLYMQEPVKEEVVQTPTSNPAKEGLVPNKPAASLISDSGQNLAVNDAKDIKPVNDSGLLDNANVSKTSSDAPAITRINEESKSADTQAIARINEEPKSADTQVMVSTTKGRDAIDSNIVKAESNVTIDPAPKSDELVKDNQRGDSANTVQTDVKVSTPVLKNRVKPESGSQVIRLYEETVAEGKRMLYVDNTSTPRDSIDILIVKEMPAGSQVGSVPAVGSKDQKEEAGSSIVLTNTNCTQSASEQDIDRLRVQMLKQKSDDDRIFAARKLLRSRCMSAAQVRALSELFPTDEGKYMFFDAAYPFVSDSGNFKELIQLLTDPYYINRFKAMVRM